MVETNIKFSTFKSIIDVLGITEFGEYLISDPEKSRVTHKKITSILSKFSKDIKIDWNRTIKTAKYLYNSLDKEFTIKGNNKGSSFKAINKDNTVSNLKQSSTYKLFLIFALAYMSQNGSFYWDTLHQFLNQKYPLSFLTFLGIAIEHKLLVSIQYKKDRLHSELFYEKLVPFKIVHRDSHWLLIVYEQDSKKWNHLLIHSILNIQPVLSDGKYCFATELEDIDVDTYFKDSFSIAKLDDREPIVYNIYVPKENYRAVRKRRKEGHWKKKDNYYIWTVSAYDEMEIFTYIFRWAGVLKLIGPENAVDSFKKQLNNQYTFTTEPI